MSQQHIIQSISLKAENSLVANQYYIVEITADHQVDVCDTQGEIMLGVLQNKPAANEAAQVAVLGTTKVISHDTAIVYGTRLTTDANGKAETAAGGDHVIGIALETPAAENDIIEMLLVHSTTPWVS